MKIIGKLLGGFLGALSSLGYFNSSSRSHSRIKSMRKVCSRVQPGVESLKRFTFVVDRSISFCACAKSESTAHSALFCISVDRTINVVLVTESFRAARLDPDGK